MKRFTFLSPRPGLTGLLLIFMLLLTACGAAASSLPTAVVPVTGGQAVQSANNAQFGQILVTADGKTLYTNSEDTASNIKCVNADCTSIWKPYTVDSQPAAPSGISGTLGLVTRPDGTKQVTFNQKPLYTFVKDTQPNDVNGNGLTDVGGTWSVVSLGGNPANPAGTQPAPTSGNGGSGGGGPSY